MTMTDRAIQGEWRVVCRAQDIPAERGVAALLPEGQVAIVRAGDDIFCIGHRDPISGANVLARGIVGSTHHDGVLVPTIASPMYKQAFDLRDGACLSEPGVRAGAWEVRERGGFIEVGRCLSTPTAVRDA